MESLGKKGKHHQNIFLNSRGEGLFVLDKKRRFTPGDKRKDQLPGNGIWNENRKKKSTYVKDVGSPPPDKDSLKREAKNTNCMVGMIYVKPNQNKTTSERTRGRGPRGKRG